MHPPTENRDGWGSPLEGSEPENVTHLRGHSRLAWALDEATATPPQRRGAVMVMKLSANNFYRIRDPKNFYAAMRADIELLRSSRRYLSLTTVIVCCLDALAAGSGEATRGKFEKFAKTHFPDLCATLEAVCAGRKGGCPSVAVPTRWLSAHPETRSMSLMEPIIAWPLSAKSSTPVANRERWRRAVRWPV